MQLSDLFSIKIDIVINCGVSQSSVLGPIIFTIYVSPIASIVSSHGVNQQQYADDICAQFFIFLSPAASAVSAASSGVSLLFKAGSFTVVWF